MSILSSIIVLSALGETVNVMTLGGLALAVGILVDDATVTIENIKRQRAGKPSGQRGDTRAARAAQTPGLPKGSRVKLRRQIQTMYSAYLQMLGGLVSRSCWCTR